MKKRKWIKTKLRLFGIKPKTGQQKRFMRYFIVIKTIVYLAIFLLALLFLWKIKNLSQ